MLEFLFSPGEPDKSFILSAWGWRGPSPCVPGAYLRWPVKELTGRQISLPGTGESLSKKVYYLKTKGDGECHS